MLIENVNLAFGKVAQPDIRVGEGNEIVTLSGICPGSLPTDL